MWFWCCRCTVADGSPVLNLQDMSSERAIRGMVFNLLLPKQTSQENCFISLVQSMGENCSIQTSPSKQVEVENVRHNYTSVLPGGSDGLSDTTTQVSYLELLCGD